MKNYVFGKKIYKHFSRKCFYTVLLCLYFLVLLLQWKNSNDLTESSTAIRPSSQKLKTTPKKAQLQTELFKPSVSDSSQEDLLSANKQKGNVVLLTLYIESQCPDTTGFIKRQLMPTWRRLSSTKRLNVQIIPFGKASCTQEDGDYICQCQHGSVECELNQLMNCVIDLLPKPSQHIPIIGCIQGGSDLKSVFNRCLNGHTSASRLWECSTSKEGRALLYSAGERTAKISSLYFVPWVVINDKRVSDAFYALEENICKRLDSPKPVQCEHFS